METTKSLGKLKDLIEKHELDSDKKLLEYGTTAILALSAIGKSTVLRNLLIGAVVIGIGKLAYDHFVAEEVEKD